MPEAIGKELKMCRIRNDLTMKNVAEKFRIIEREINDEKVQIKRIS